MISKLIASFKYLFLFFIGLAIVFFLFRNQYNPHFLLDLKKANWAWAAFSGFLVLAAHFFRALRWQLMITPIATQKPKFKATFYALMLGYLINLVLPRAGEVARCAVLAKKENISMASLIGTVIAERIIDLLMLMLLIIGAVFLYADLLLSFFKSLPLTTYAIGTKMIWLSLIAVLAVVFTSFLIYRYKNSKLVSNLKSWIFKLKEGLLSIKKIKNLFLFIAYTLSIWLCYILSSYVCFSVFSQTAILDFSAAILTVIAGSFGMIAPIQGGIGAFHFMVSETLALLSINKSVALEYATVVHAVQTMIVIIFGLLGLILGFDFKNRLHEKQ